MCVHIAQGTRVLDHPCMAWITYTHTISFLFGCDSTEWNFTVCWRKRTVDETMQHNALGQSVHT